MTAYELLSWGANSHHQLGQNVDAEQCVNPTAVNLKNFKNNAPELSGIKKLTGGAGHSLLLTIDGELYSCGLNNKGQAGKSKTTNKLLKFERIDKLKNELIVDVACGWDSSMAINKNGHLFAWGSNAFGQLGVKKNNNKNDGSLINSGNEYSDVGSFDEPTMVDFNHEIDESENENEPDKVSHVAMGLRHSVIVTKNGKVLVSGYGNKCQLGIIDASNKPINKINSFTRVPELTNVKEASCGQHHTIALTNDGDLWVWGDNKHGQLGIDIEKYPVVKTPIKLSNLNVGTNGEIFAGWTHTAALHDGKLFTWGRNTYGQIGRETELSSINNIKGTWIPELVKNLPKLIQFSIGSEHNVALGENGSIMCWGWNEHGNCGTGNDEDVKTPTPIEIPKNSKGVLVGTGYGHSFAILKYN